jgi:hypothetical protein
LPPPEAATLEKILCWQAIWNGDCLTIMRQSGTAQIRHLNQRPDAAASGSATSFPAFLAFLPEKEGLYLTRP